jgi:hypothetical protein
MKERPANGGRVFELSHTESLQLSAGLIGNKSCSFYRLSRSSSCTNVRHMRA